MYSPRKLHDESVIFSKHYFSIENITFSRCLVQIQTGIILVQAYISNKDIKVDLLEVL